MWLGRESGYIFLTTNLPVEELLNNAQVKFPSIL